MNGTPTRMARTLKRIDELVARAEEAISRDHNRRYFSPEHEAAGDEAGRSCLAYDFGALSADVAAMREALDDLRAGR